MLSVTRSAAYFGPSLHEGGPAAYLRVHVQGPAAQGWTGISPNFIQAVDDFLSGDMGFRSDGGDADAVAEDVGELPDLIVATVERLCRMVGEIPATVRQVESVHDGDLEFIAVGEDAETVRRAGLFAIELLELVLATRGQPDVWMAQALKFFEDIESLKQFATARRLSSTETAIKAAAEERNIPVILLDRWPLPEVHNQPPEGRNRGLQLGWGIHCKRLNGTASDVVPHDVYAALADRHATNARLRGLQIAVPYRDPEFPNASSARRAASRASRIGYPVVIKARYRSAGRASVINLCNEGAVLDAYARLTDDNNREVVVERQVPGDTYRLLIIGGEVVAAIRTPDLARRSMMVAVGVDQLAPPMKATAIEAVQAFDLPIAAVALVTVDPATSLKASGGAIVGLDPAPDLDAYAGGSEPLRLALAKRFLERLLPGPGNGRIPICAVTGTNGKTTTSRMIAKILQWAGHRVGLACTDGVYVEGQAVQTGTASGIAGALALFFQRNIDFAVLETSRGTLVQKGLAFERCEVAACTNIACDHLGEEGIDTLDQMARLKRVVIEAASECAVLNADDPRCVGMLPFVQARQTYLVSSSPALEEVDAHVAGGGRAIVLGSGADGRCIMLRTKDGQLPIVTIDQIPATWKGAARHNIENAMFATAVALAFGVQVHIIQAALRSFTSSIEETPGRINVYDKLPFKVVLDFAHNAHGLQALCDFVRQIDHGGRRHLVAYWTRSAPRDPDLLEAMKTVAPYFDSFICRDAAGTAGDAMGKVAARLESALLYAGVPRAAVRVIPNFETAIDTALREAEPGDLVTIITGSKAHQVWQQIDSYWTRLEAKASQ